MAARLGAIEVNSVETIRIGEDEDPTLVKLILESKNGRDPIEVRTNIRATQTTNEEFIEDCDEVVSPTTLKFYTEFARI
jgi:hypothetical protein